MISATQLRKGTIIVYKDELYRVIDIMHTTPGNKRGFMQTTMKRLSDGVQAVEKFSSDVSIERAILEQHEVEDLYADGNMYHFMNTENYEQIMLSEEQLGDQAKFLQPNCKVQLDMYDGKAVGIELQQNMTFKVTDADPTVKRATASAQFKNATLENGVTIRVPAFVQSGDSIIVDTTTGEYVGRA